MPVKLKSCANVDFCCNAHLTGITNHRDSLRGKSSFRNQFAVFQTNFKTLPRSQNGSNTSWMLHQSFP